MISETLNSTENPDEARFSRPRWHLLYFVLAAFDLLTVSVSLYLNHNLVDRYQEAVRMNEIWVNRLNQYSEMIELTNIVNVAGNDVFETRDVASSRDRLQVAVLQFDLKMSEARQELLRRGDPDHGTSLLKKLESIEIAMESQTKNAEQIFAFFEARQPEKAGGLMAQMDRYNAEVNIYLGKLCSEVAGHQADRLRRQAAAANPSSRLPPGVHRAPSTLHWPIDNAPNRESRLVP